MRRIRVAIGLLTLGLLHVTAVWAQEVVVVDFVQVKDTVPQGWELHEHEGKADLALVPDGVSQVLKLRSRLSSFSLNKELGIDLTKTPYLEWQWKVTELPKGGDFRKSATDDQAAQLYVVFYWGVFKKQAIAYIWDSTAPVGTTAKVSPPVPLVTIYAVVVRSGDKKLGKWVTETRNVVEDYKKLFGSKVKEVQAIRIQINSQHTKSEAESYWRFVRFKAHP
ncbi:MAG: DUF3047 domain-containing protein [candidate division NC10 bacterium]|nr:DUF3047 domain-containing protein [candidate division NC10 bacterium]